MRWPMRVDGTYALNASRNAKSCLIHLSSSTRVSRAQVVARRSTAYLIDCLGTQSLTGGIVLLGSYYTIRPEMRSLSWIEGPAEYPTFAMRSITTMNARRCTASCITGDEKSFCDTCPRDCLG